MTRTEFVMNSIIPYLENNRKMMDVLEDAWMDALVDFDLEVDDIEKCELDEQLGYSDFMEHFKQKIDEYVAILLAGAVLGLSEDECTYLENARGLDSACIDDLIDDSLAK